MRAYKSSEVKEITVTSIKKLIETYSTYSLLHITALFNAFIRKQFQAEQLSQRNLEKIIINLTQTNSCRHTNWS